MMFAVKLRASILAEFRRTDGMLNKREVEINRPYNNVYESNEWQLSTHAENVGDLDANIMSSWNRDREWAQHGFRGDDVDGGRVWLIGLPLTSDSMSA